MTGDKFRIKAVKSYEVFDLGVSSDEPMDEPDEQQLYAWLRARGFSDEEAGEIINQVDGQGTYDIIMP